MSDLDLDISKDKEPAAPPMENQNLLAENTIPAQDIPPPMPEAEPEPMAPAPVAAPMPAPAAPIAAAPAPVAPPPPTVKQQLLDEGVKTSQDLAAGHIKPETYKDLFAKKDTLGKIGTIFGLLVSGAGSGLTGQPNALLEMMNKEIERDMQAQQNSSSNAQNLLKINQANEYNKAQIALAGETGNLTAAQAKLAKATADMTAYNLTKIQLNRIGLHDLVTKASKYPPGSQERQVADQKLAMMGKLVDDENLNIADRAELASAMLNAKFTSEDSGGAAKEATAETPAVDINRMNKLIDIGRQNPDKPGVIPPSQVDAVQKASDLVRRNRSVLSGWDDSFKKLSMSALAGKLNPSLRKAEVETLAGRMTHDLGLSQEQALRFIDGALPSEKDYGTARSEKYRKGLEHFKGLEAGTTILDNYDLKSPFPKYTFKTVKSKKGSEGEGGSKLLERVTADGRTALFDPETKQFLRYKDSSSVAGK